MFERSSRLEGARTTKREKPAKERSDSRSPSNVQQFLTTASELSVLIMRSISPPTLSEEYRRMSIAQAKPSDYAKNV
jgi:hypothetical protein